MEQESLDKLLSVDDYFKEFLIKIIGQSVKYDANKYKELIENFLQFFKKDKNNLQLSMDDCKSESNVNNKNILSNSNSNILLSSLPLYSKQNFYIYQILTIITNFDIVFLNDCNNSLEVTFPFVLSLIENKILEGHFIILSYLNKLVNIATQPSFLKSEYLERLSSLLNSISSSDENIYILSEQLKTSLQKSRNKNLIEFFEDIDKQLERESILEKDSLFIKNGSFASDSLNQEFILLDKFKSNVNKNINSEDIIKVYYELKKEEEAIQKEKDERLLGSFFTGRISNLNMKYLYLFNKILRSLDNAADANLKRIFYNLVLRSKIFSSYLLKTIKISCNFIQFKDRDLYIHQYASIGDFFFSKILNSDVAEKAENLENKMKNFGKMVDKVIENLKNLISRELDKKKSTNEFRFLIYNFEESLMNKEISCYTCNSSYSLEYNQIMMNVNIYNLKYKNKDIILKDISIALNSVSQINKLKLIKQTFYLNINTKLFPHMRVIISINSSEVFRLNSLYPLVKYDPVVLNLFIYIKYWAMQRSMMYTFDDAFNGAPERDSLFDSSNLLLLLIYFLIQSGYLPKLEKVPLTKFTTFFNQRRFKEITNSEDTIEEFDFNEVYYITHDYKIFNSNLNLKNSSLSSSLLFRKTELIGKLFINFFYFLLTIIDKFKTHPDYCLVLDLNFNAPIVVKHAENDRIILIDNLCKYQINKCIKFSEMQSYCNLILGNNNLIDQIQLNILFKGVQEDFDILEIWNSNKISILEQEACRVLHFAFNQDPEEFIKIFLKFNL